MKNKYLIGIDTGTSVVKSVVFDIDGNEISVFTIPTENDFPYPGWVEKDMDDLWEKVKYCVKKVVLKSKLNINDIKGIGITATGDGTWMIDNNDNPVRPGIYWCDGRAANIVERWIKNGISQEAFEICGTAVFTGSQSTQVNWLLENEPESVKKAKIIFHCKDWIYYKFTGKITTDESDESLPMLNMATRAYDERLFKLFGLDKYTDKYPNVYPCEENFCIIKPEVAKELGLKKNVLVSSGPMDVVACAVGTGTIGSGEACSILGTAGIHEISMDSPLIEPKMVGMTLCHAHKKKWIRLLAAMVATPNLDWFLEHFCKDYQAEAKKEGVNLFKYVDKIVERIPIGCEGVMYHPYIFPGGERAPFVKPSARANFTGINIKHSVDHLLRSIYEGVGFATLDCYKNMPLEVKVINLSGGGAKSDVWCQMIADIIGKTVRIPSGSEFGAKGAAINTGIALRFYNGFEDAILKTVKYRREFKPNLNNTERYNELYKLYKMTYKKLMDTWDLRAKLNI